jgi:diamine N-acetyltransferase
VYLGSPFNPIVLMLTKNHITLRLPQSEDLSVLHQWENDSEAWLVSQNATPVSRTTLTAYINSVHDIYLQKQLKLMIVHSEFGLSGMVDLFEFDSKNRKVGLGIYVDKDLRDKNIATDSIVLVQEYAKNILNLRMIWCTVLSNNKLSLGLFKKLGYMECGVRREWIENGEKLHDEHMFQLML